MPVEKNSPLLANWIVKTVQAVSPWRANYTRLWKHIAVCRAMLQTNLFDMPPEALDINSEDGLRMKLYNYY